MSARFLKIIAMICQNPSRSFRVKDFTPAAWDQVRRNEQAVAMVGFGFGVERRSCCTRGVCPVSDNPDAVRRLHPYHPDFGAAGDDCRAGDADVESVVHQNRLYGHDQLGYGVSDGCREPDASMIDAPTNLRTRSQQSQK